MLGEMLIIVSVFVGFHHMSQSAVICQPPAHTVHTDLNISNYSIFEESMEWFLDTRSTTIPKFRGNF